MTPDQAMDLVSAHFEGVRLQLRRGGRLKGPKPMVAAAKHVRVQAARRWRLEVGNYEKTFFISNAQVAVRFDRLGMGAVFAKAIDSVRGSQDVVIADAIGALQPENVDAVLMTGLLGLFLAHEYLHFRQRIGSSQYQDSEHYAATVTPVDYQADVAALWYVTRYTDRPAGLDPRMHLVLLVALHISTMQAFRDEGEELDRLTFERLFVWYLQFARFASSDEEPDLDHASVQSMPILSFPRVDPAIAAKVSVDRLTAVGNDRPDVLFDIVLTMANGDGLLSILRSASTDRGRLAEIVTAIVEADFAKVRDALDEVKIHHEAAFGFAAADPTRDAVEQLQALAAGLEMSPQPLTFATEAVVQFFREAERLVFLPKSTLEGEGIDDIRLWWADGLDAWIAREVAALPQADELRATVERSAVIREVLRVAIRLGESLDELQA